MPKTYTQTVAPVKQPRLYRMELIAPVVVAGIDGAQSRIPGVREGDEILVDEQMAIHLLSHKWALLKKGEQWPGEPPPTLGAPLDPNNLPSRPVVKLPKNLRVKLLKPNVSLGCGITDAKVGSTYVLPASTALYLAGQGIVEIVSDMPKPEVEVGVIRSNPKPLMMRPGSPAPSWRA